MAAEVQSQQQQPVGPTTEMIESLQARTTSIRRSRPPDIVVKDADRAPLRPSSRSERRISRRESRVGLRGILGLTGKDQNGRELVGGSASMRETSRTAAVRASLSDITHWPYNPSRSEVSLMSNSTTSPPTSSRSTFSGVRKQNSMPRFKHLNGSPSKLPEAFNSTPDLWAPSPLFQAYPQAIKTATLPACTARNDTLFRRNGARSSVLVRDERLPDEEVERPRKLHHKHSSQRHSLEWTTKTYVLITSGYLLQYSSDGSFDRLPERILRLTRDSAAFASDLIPGRHWVIQVVSSMGVDGAPNSDARSLLSKLAHWGSDKKSASSFLMVLESAEEMEEWLTLLRQEIQNLGGKRQLSETGEPMPECKSTEPLLNHRTMVLRDPERFSSLMPQDFSWSSDNIAQYLPPNPTAASSIHEVTPDDASTAESHDSSDGHRLDSLRGSSNRLSYISSGQRTVITSANSTPACSPTRESFSSNPSEVTSSPSQETDASVRKRPNAQAIASRRQSMQAMIPLYEAHMEPNTRPRSAMSSCMESGAANQQNVPNFSKRFADSKLSPGSPEQAPNEVEPSLRWSRRPPPTALAMARPLSTVVDLPSPRTPLSPIKPMLGFDAARTDRDSMRRSLLVEKSATLALPQDAAKAVAHHQGSTPQPAALPRLQSQLAPRTAPRQSISLASLRPRKDSLSEHPRFVLSSSVAARKAQFEAYTGSHAESPRSFTTGAYKAEGKTPPPPTAIPSRQSSACRRSSHTPHDQPRSYSRESGILAMRTLSPNTDHRPAKRQSLAPLLPSNAYLESHAPGRRLTIQRSMPHLVEGPPLAPPPNRALPPIPKKH